MKKLIAVLMGLSMISTAAIAEDVQPTSPNKDAVMQQLADNNSDNAATASDASKDQNVAPAEKMKAKKKKCAKHCKKHHKKHHHKKQTETKTTETTSDTTTAPASDANATK